MNQRTEDVVVDLQRSSGFPNKIGVEPGIVNVALLVACLQVLSEVGVDRDQAGLELSLNTDVLHFEIQLDVFLESVGDLVVDDLW